MKLDTQDPRLMDYVLNELPAEEAVEIRAALEEAENEDARAEVEALRVLMGKVAEALNKEGLAESLEETAKESIITLAAEHNVVSLEDEQKKRRNFIFRYVQITVVAALLVAIAGVAVIPMFSKARETAKNDAPNVRPSLSMVAAQEGGNQGAMTPEMAEQMGSLGYLGDAPASNPEATEKQSSLQNVAVDGQIRVRGNYYDGDESITLGDKKSHVGQRTRLGVSADFTDKVSKKIESVTKNNEQLQSLGYFTEESQNHFYDRSNSISVEHTLPVRRSPGTESYSDITDNDFQEVRQAPLSTFSIDVDTASYSNVRRFLDGGQIPPADAVRIEELINNFDYSYAPPTDGKPFAAHVEVAACPWNTEHYIARIGLKGYEMPASERPNGNYVFLVDVSGSMDEPNKLPLVKESLKALTEQLEPRDRIGIVTYAGSSSTLLQSTSCDDKQTILNAIESMRAGSGTNGSAGIRGAYAMARENFIEGGVNRVILATDGDFNVGITSHGELENLIATEAKSNVFLTALGYGMGNYKDDTLELFADKGNGNYAYIDSYREVRRTLVQKLTSTIMTIAKDVKIQVEFNPSKVASYRLIGYENRMLAARDFNDDTKDAGEIGAGHTVTALYEIVPIGASPQPGVDPLRYQENPASSVEPVAGVGPVPSPVKDELFLLKLRYKEPEGDKSALMEIPVAQVPVSIESASADTRFVAAVAAFGMTLRNSPHKGTADLDMAKTLAESALNSDEARQEFLDMIVTAKTLVK